MPIILSSLDSPTHAPRSIDKVKYARLLWMRWSIDTACIVSRPGSNYTSSVDSRRIRPVSGSFNRIGFCSERKAPSAGILSTIAVLGLHT